MPTQHPSQYPLGYRISEYASLPSQRRSLEATPAQEVRGAQDTGAITGYAHYVGHQYSQDFNQPQYTYAHHAPLASLATGHTPRHHHHSSSTGSAPHAENSYSSYTSDSAYASGALALASTHHPPSLLPHSYHPHLTLADAGYHNLLSTHGSPHSNPGNYQSSFSCPVNQLAQTSVPVSPTHSNPASISPSLSSAEYTGVLAEYPFPASSAHDYSPRQPLLTSPYHSPSASPPAANHRPRHSLTSFPRGPADSNATYSMQTAHQYNSQPSTTSITGIPTSGSSRSRHAHHESASNLYSPYSPSRAPPISSSPPLDPPRPHICEICQAAFQRNHDLKRHKDGHSDTKPFVCQCGRAFTRKDALKRHMFLKNCGKDKGHESA